MEAAPETTSPSVRLHPLRGDKAQVWTVQLEEDILTLLSPEGRIVMMLPREEAVRSLRFEWDVLHGRVVSFVLMEGLRAYRLSPERGGARRIAGWLPQRSAEETDREARLHAAGLILAGALQLFFPELFLKSVGLAFILLGLAEIFLIHRLLFALNAVLLFTTGIGFLLGLSSPTPWQSLLPAGLGAILVLWSVQQCTLLGLNHHVRGAIQRALDGDTPLPGPSRTIRRIALALGLMAALCAAQVVVLCRLDYYPAPALWVMLATLTFVNAALAFQLYFPRHLAFAQAKVAGQFAILLAILFTAGLLRVLAEPTAMADPGLLPAGLLTLGTPYPWLPLITLVLLFNWWYPRAIRRELEERGE